ncbi:MAG: VWA domain-containing protein [Saprospiraceae bacterium]|nr:VWA domain-containing protein [Saprospiraceae bacterium]
MNSFEFQHPWFFLLFIIIAIMIWQQYFKPSKMVEIAVPGVRELKYKYSLKSLLFKYLPLLRILALSAFIFALARPQSVLKEEEVKAEGIDIMLVMDLSSSMLARDFDPDRLTVSKQMAQDFIDKRSYDRIGLVVFAGESFTQSPLTTDHRVLKNFLGQLESGLLDDGTAIGMGLASAVNRLKESEAKSKVVILLTDGVNNAGYIKPMTAAEIAKSMGVKVYTIGVGSMGNAISPTRRRSDGVYVFANTRVEIDEALLTEISKLTGGQYFRATDEASLQSIYEQIDQFEKTEIEVSVFKRYSEEFRFFLFIGLICLILEWLFKNTILRSVP